MKKKSKKVRLKKSTTKLIRQQIKWRKKAEDDVKAFVCWQVGAPGREEAADRANFSLRRVACSHGRYGPRVATAIQLMAIAGARGGRKQ